jgi:hypothetical protein
MALRDISRSSSSTIKSERHHAERHHAKLHSCLTRFKMSDIGRIKRKLPSQPLWYVCDIDEYHRTYVFKCTVCGKLTLKESLEVHFLLKKMIGKDCASIVMGFLTWDAMRRRMQGGEVVPIMGFLTWDAMRRRMQGGEVVPKPTKLITSRCVFHQGICHLAHCNKIIWRRGQNFCWWHWRQIRPN